MDEQLVYFPVNVAADKRALLNSKTCLLNPLYPTTKVSLEAIRKKFSVSDSSGLQIITQGLNKGRRVAIGPTYQTRVNKSANFLTIGFLSNCMEYHKTNSNIAFCVDVPSRSSDSDAVYYYKMSKALIARNSMLEIAEQVCPETNIGIVLQPRHPMEIENYFSLVATPQVKLYAYPAQSKLVDSLGNAFVLSFLRSVGVRHVHFMGSSAVTVITLLAKAIVLNLFKTCSFDSRTWNQPSVGNAYRYLNPMTLASLPRDAPLPPYFNLQWILKNHKNFWNQFEREFNPPQFMKTKEWLGIVNIQAIKYFKNRTIDRLSLPERYRQITQEKRYSRLIPAMNLLEESKRYGHDFVKGKYTGVLI